MTINGPLGMYKLKPFYETFKKLDLPNCMYQMKNLHATSETGAKKEVSEPYQELAKRQECIINRLEELKVQVDKLKRELGVHNVTKSDISASLPEINLQNKEFPSDIVINASPNNPPLSIWVLRNKLQEMNFKVSLTTHVHSSVMEVDLPENIKKLPSDTPDNRMKNHIKFTLIWKNVGLDPEMIVNPLLQNAIQGEANVVRYIARLCWPGYLNLDPDIATNIDCWLDKGYFSLLQGNNKEHQSFLRQLNGHLGKAEYIVGKDVTVADIFVWSAIVQLQLEKSLPSNVTSWWKRLNTKTIFTNII